jgi:hypothetical protein
VKRREMLRKSMGDLAQILPLALAATGSLGRLLSLKAGLTRPREAASFPTGNREGAGKAQVITTEEV